MKDLLADTYDGLAHEGALTPDPAQRAALCELQAIRTALEAPATGRGLIGGLFARPAEAPRGLYLWGAVGRGKSMLMDLFFAETRIEAKRRVHFHAFMQDVQARLHEARKAEVDDAILPVAEAVSDGLRLLCFDEVQVTDIADAMILGRLFQALLARGVTIVATSNREPDGLYKDGLNRPLFLPFIALLKGRMAVLELEAAGDYRRHRLAGAQVYFTPPGAAAKAAIEALWRDLTGGGNGPLKLTVKGREVVLPQARSGVARASFWDLCGRPLGPADYLAIAGAVRVLIVEDIPILSAENFNEARRFVTLIDALYEARVRLICSAAALPDRLYIEGEGTFEFARTTSRLIEMQGADWAGQG